MTRPLAVFCLLSSVGCLLSQEPSDPVWLIEVTTSQNYLLSGRTLRLEARATTLSGSPAPNFSPEWRSSDARIAQVDASGMVRGLLPGEAQIEALADGIAGGITLRVDPLRIEVRPAFVELEVGQRVELTARALNADGAPLTDARFLWSSGLPGVAAVDGSGAVTGAAEGSANITVFLETSSSSPGWSSQVPVRVRPRQPFRITPLTSGDREIRPVTIRRIEYLAAAGDRIAMTAILSTGGQALLLGEGSELRALAMTGQYLDLIGQIVDELIEGVSLNSRGDLLARVRTLNGPQRLLVFRPPQYLPEIVPGSEAFGGIWVHRGYMGERGEILFRGWDNRGENLMFRRQDGRLERIATLGDQLPGFGAVNWFGEASIASGRIVFHAQGSGRTGTFEWDGRQIRKVVAVSDTVSGRTVRWIHGFAPIASSGEVYLAAGFDDGNQILRWSGGALSTVVQTGIPLANGATLHWIDNFRDLRGGALLLSGGSDRGNGLFKLENGALDLLARYGGSVQNEEWSWFDQAYFNTQGGVTVLGPQANTISRVARLGAGPSVTLVEAGRTLDQPAPAFPPLWSFRGTSAGPVGVTIGQALVRVSRDSIQPFLLPGDVLPGGPSLRAIRIHALSRNGDIAFHAETTQGQGLLLWRDGRIVQLFAQWSGEAKGPGGANIHWFNWPIAVNNNGQVVTWTQYEGGSGLLLFSEGSRTPQTVYLNGAAAPGGGTFFGPSQVAIDDRGRVAFLANPGGPWALFLWDNGQIRKLRQIGDPGPGGLPASAFEGPLLATGNKFYSYLRFGGYQAFEIAEYDADGARPRVTTDLCGGNFSVASNGDIAYASCSRSGIVVRKLDGREALAASTNQRTSGGEWLLLFLGWHLTDQGELVFGALTPTGFRDRLGLYLAQ